MQDILLHLILCDSLLEFKTGIQFGCICAFILLYYDNCRNFINFGSRELTLHSILVKSCLHPIIAFSLAAFMPELFLLYYNNWRNLINFGWITWCCIHYWQQFVHIQTCIKFFCMYACIHAGIWWFVALETLCIEATMLHPILVLILVL